MACIILLDNGSLRANAALQLRVLASQLTELCGEQIHPVSCKHSDQIPPSELEGKAANIFEHFVSKQLAASETTFIVLPLFFGRSRAITDFIPKVSAQLEEKFGPFSVSIADCIYPLPAGEETLTEIVYEHVLSSSQLHIEHSALENRVLVDHGSPVPRVTAVREHLANAVRRKLGESTTLEEAVMEKRAGNKYDFNGILLQDWLIQKAQAGETQAAVILLFFLPGSHAGEGGDIAEICSAVMKKYPAFKITISPLISEHPKLISILQKRLSSVLDT